MSWLEFMEARSSMDDDIVRPMPDEFSDVRDDEVGGECGYCGFGIDPEVICQSCWDSMQLGET